MWQRFTHNWNLKLMSLVLAVALWSHVRGEMNPWETTTFRVPLSYRPPASMILLNRDKIPAHVKVTLRAPRLRLRELKGFAPPNPLATGNDPPLLSREEIQARLDFSLARLGKQNIPTRVSVSYDDVEVLGKPEDIVVVLDRASRRTVPIEPQFQVARGYDVTDVLLRDGEALLYGPANALERVASVRAKIRSGALRLNSAKTVEFPLQALDEDGDVVEDVRLEPETVAVSAVLRESVVSARLPVEVKVVGDWPDNVEVADVLVTPRRLTVRGPQRAVEGLKALPVTLSAPTGSTLPASSTRLRRRLWVPLPRRVRAVGNNEVLVTVLLSRNVATPDARTGANESPDTVTPTPSRTAPPLATPQAEVTDDAELPPARRDNTSSEVP